MNWSQAGGGGWYAQLGRIGNELESGRGAAGKKKQRTGVRLGMLARTITKVGVTIQQPTHQDSHICALQGVVAYDES